MPTTSCPTCNAPVAPYGAGRGRPRVYCSDACRKRSSDVRTGHRRKKTYRVKNAKPIIGVDSETISDDEGYTTLTLIAASDGAYIENREGIDSQDALNFLCDRPGELWTFYGDYDVIQWLKDFSFDALDQLRREGYAYWHEFKVHHIPRRVFQVWNRETGKSAIVYDVWPFAQSSFVKWLRDWNLTDEDTIARIENMKGQRNNFSQVSDEDIRAYTFDEVRLIATGVAQLKERVIASGYIPARWLGPGAVAAKALRVHNVKAHYPIEHEAVRTAAETAYYGGRVETSLVGRFPDSVYYYDINSAYPDQATRLPCLAHGEWKRTTRFDRTRTQLLQVTWDMGPDRRWGPFPVRLAPGSPLRYPSIGSGWYWNVEIAPWVDKVRIRKGYEWVPDCDHVPMDWLREIYDKRRALKDEGNPAEYALKLILNSCYGKLAQRVGAAPYFNPEWAGIITAGCRGRLGEIIARYPDEVLLTATDGLLASIELPIETDNGKLGAWSVPDVFDWVDIWQPGFYLLSDNYVRTRGFSARDIDPEAFRNAWDTLDILGQVPVARRRVIGYRLATAWGKPDMVGRWLDSTAYVSFDPAPRRILAEKVGSYSRTNAPYIDDDPDDTWQFGQEILAARRDDRYLDDGIPLGMDAD